MLAIRRAGQGASYVPYREGVVPWHSAMAATYAHATAPLRRLADRYVVRRRCRSPAARPRGRGGDLRQITRSDGPGRRARRQVDRADIDLAEAMMLDGRRAMFRAVVTDIDERGARIQLSDPAVIRTLSTARVRCRGTGSRSS